MIHEDFEIDELLGSLKTKKAKREFLVNQVGSLSAPTKMPGFAYSTPAQDCITGSKLRKVEGSVCSSCYAMKGRYLFPNVQNAMDTRLNAVRNNPKWHVYMKALIELESKEPYFRWHDSGDLQSVRHLEQICWIAEQLEDIYFWLPTRENAIVKALTVPVPSNLCIRVSHHKVDSFKSARSFQWRSSVITDESKSTGQVCPATRKDSDHKCGKCRACWDTSVAQVDYLIH